MKNLFFSFLLTAGFAVQGFSNGADSANFYVKKAVEFSKTRKLLDADRSFQKAISFNPADNQTRIEYGTYLLEQRKYTFAIEQFAKVLESNINHAVALQKMTEVSFQLHRWNDVVMYGTKLMQNGGMKDIKYMVGKSHYELENYGQAQKLLGESLVENPKKIEAVTLLGKVLIEMSNYKQAIAVYNQALQIDPENNQLTYELGLLYYTMNDEKSAVKYFELAAAKGYKTDLDYYENLGLAYLDIDFAKGKAALDIVLEKKPGNSDILFQIAQSYYKAEKYQDAADSYYAVYKNDQNNSRALYMAGVSYQKKGDKNKGVAICEEAIRMDPNLAQLKSQKFMF